MAKKQSKQCKQAKPGVAVVSPKTPGAFQFDFANQDGAVRSVEGTYKDLIVDGHGHTVPWIMNLHADPKDNKAAVLLGRGSSATKEKLERFAAAGIPIMAVNDYPKDGPKPRYWCTGDPPHYFSERVWSDPDVMKFCGFHNRDGVRPRDGAYEPKHLVRDAPNTMFFHQTTNETDVEHWLFHPIVVWGSTIGCVGGPEALYAHGAARSSMLIGLKLLWFLGYRRVYLVGCDCVPHHHPASEYWNTIFHLVTVVAKHFKQWGYNVYQTYEDSHLRCFDFADWKAVTA